MKTTNPVVETLNARVYDVCVNTPLDMSVKLSKRYDCLVFYKREDLQATQSFKARGAFHKVSSLTPDERSRGVLAASAGNHAQGVALAAQYFDIPCTIVMPRTTPSIKVEAVKHYGAEVVLYGDNYSEAAEHCHELRQSSKMTYIAPFDDIDVIRGQGTIAVELLADRHDITHVIVPVGGGGLIAGIADYIKEVRPEISIIGVESADSASMKTSIEQGKIVSLMHVGIFADGVAVKQPGELTYDIVKRCVDEIVTVSEDEICSAIKDIYLDTRTIVEPSGAMSVAALNKVRLGHDAVVVCLLSGANMNFERLQFIAERTLLGSGQEMILAIRLPEKPGALKDLLKDVIKDHNISEFSYRYNSSSEAWIYVGINVRGARDREALLNALKENSYAYHDLSGSGIAKNHVRHMIGGKGPATLNETIYDVTFPERSGALYDFVSQLPKEASITMFHYRGTGSDHSSVLLGVSADESSSLHVPGYSINRVDDATINIFI